MKDKDKDTVVKLFPHQTIDLTGTNGLSILDSVMILWDKKFKARRIELLQEGHSGHAIVYASVLEAVSICAQYLNDTQNGEKASRELLAEIVEELFETGDKMAENNPETV